MAGLEDDSFLTARRKMKMAMSKVCFRCKIGTLYENLSMPIVLFNTLQKISIYIHVIYSGSSFLPFIFIHTTRLFVHCFGLYTGSRFVVR